MHVAAIYDIHANLPALEAVIEEIRQAKVEQIIVGGDVVPGPMCRETIAYLLDLDIPTLFIQGNGDREVAAQINGIETDWSHYSRTVARAGGLVGATTGRRAFTVAS